MRQQPSRKTERAVDKIVAQEFRLEKQLRELVKKKRLLYADERSSVSGRREVNSKVARQRPRVDKDE